MVNFYTPVVARVIVPCRPMDAVVVVLLFFRLSQVGHWWMLSQTLPIVRSFTEN